MKEDEGGKMKRERPQKKCELMRVKVAGRCAYKLHINTYKRTHLH